MTTTALTERVARAIPRGTLALDTFVRLAAVDVTDTVDTAAVAFLGGRPQLLLNPRFVAEHCERDEHLTLLVLHELWHVMLGHLRMFQQPTPAVNIACDAIINAGLTRQHRAPEYRGFFESLNPADRFPACLLRPPPGWPDDPDYSAGEFPPNVSRALRRLYPPTGEDGAEPLIFEVLLLLERPSRLSTDVVLLGDHHDSGTLHRPADDDRAAGPDPVDALARHLTPALGTIPSGLLPGRGGTLSSWSTALARPGAAARKVFARALRRALGPVRGAADDRERREARVSVGTGVLPNPRDRQHWARRRLGLPTTLCTQDITTFLPDPRPARSAHVYLDVSGSMASALPPLLGLLDPWVRTGGARVFQFSTQVWPLSRDDLRAGSLRTTGGTSIECVLAHALKDPQLERMLVVTDGYTGVPSDEHVAALRARRTRVHLVLSEAGSAQHLAGIATSSVELPV